MVESSKPIRVAEFKARLSAYLRAVREGRSLTIFDRDTPIARVVPFTAPGPLPSRPPKGALADAPLPRRPVAPDFDSLGVLLELRRDRQ
jgi:prevent-host-death family protein